MKSDKKVAKEAQSLEVQISRLGEDISNKKREIKEKTTSLEVFSKRLGELEENQETSERYKDIQSCLKTKEDKKTKLKAKIGQIDYNHALLDKMWILCAFPAILQEFKQKCSALSREKRQQEKDYDKQRAIEIGKLLRCHNELPSLFSYARLHHLYSMLQTEELQTEAVA